MPTVKNTVPEHLRKCATHQKGMTGFNRKTDVEFYSIEGMRIMRRTLSVQYFCGCLLTLASAPEETDWRDDDPFA